VAGTRKAAAPVTLIVYSGNVAEAKAFATTEGLDPHQTVLLPDPELKVTDDIYHLDICPRVFVLDESGNVRYTNNHSDDAARVAPALAIVSRALSAVRACPQPNASLKPSAP
jgi:ferredoxin